MGSKTEISWCNSTFNPWIGCTKVSPGCANCYAEALMDKRYGKVKWGPAQERKRTSVANWKLPLKWNREAGRQQSCGDCDPCIGGRPDQCAITPIKRPRVFCASLADWLDEDAEIQWLADLLMLIRATPNLDWLLLSKRLENFEPRLLEAWASFGETGSRTDWVFEWATQNCAPPNVWVGTSVENQAMADKRIPELLKVPARVRFLSVEPMLGPIDFTFPGGGQADTPYALRGNFWEVACENHCSFAGSMSALIPDPEQTDQDAERNGTVYVCPKCHCESGLVFRDDEWPGIDWAIFGGESGPGARPCNIEWIRSGVKQCRKAGVAAFAKQLGSTPHVSASDIEPHTKHRLTLVDRKGGDMAEWPEDLRVREFPGVAR